MNEKQKDSDADVPKEVLCRQHSEELSVWNSVSLKNALSAEIDEKMIHE